VTLKAQARAARRVVEQALASAADEAGRWRWSATLSRWLDALLTLEEAASPFRDR
jgi:hypothetical protein